MSDDAFGPPAPERQAVDDSSQVRVAVQLAARVARSAGFGPEAVSVITLVATELAENLHRHALGGQLLVIPPASTNDELVLLAVDSGPGVERFELCLVDGYTTIGTLGVGLGAVRRLAARFDAVSEIGRGTVVCATFTVDRDTRTDVARPAFDLGAVGFPVAPEVRNGDSWGVVRRGSRLVVTVADGLGHGPDAALASRALVDAVPAVTDVEPVAVLVEAARAARHTRGAAATVATLERDALQDGGVVDSAGLGNVTLAVVSADGSVRRAASSYGTAGRGTPRVNAVATPFPRGSTLVLHTDGLHTRWDLAGRVELLRHGAVVVAAVLWRDFARDTDDNCVVVVRAGGTG